MLASKLVCPRDAARRGALTLVGDDVRILYRGVLETIGKLIDADAVPVTLPPTTDFAGIDPDLADFFLGSESLVVTDRPGMAKWREHLFAFMSRNATSAANFFGLPPERTTTVGTRVEL